MKLVTVGSMCFPIGLRKTTTHKLNEHTLCKRLCSDIRHQRRRRRMTHTKCPKNRAGCCCCRWWDCGRHNERNTRRRGRSSSSKRRRIGGRTRTICLSACDNKTAALTETATATEKLLSTKYEVNF